MYNQAGQQRIDWFMTLLEEGQEVSLSTMIDTLYRTNVPKGVYKSPKSEEKVGNLVYLELYEQENGKHVLRGGIQEV